MAMERQESPHHHVHFSDSIDREEEKHSHSHIIVQNCDELIQVHLGFLQIYHRYEIEFDFECPEPLKDHSDIEVSNDPVHCNIIPQEVRVEPFSDTQKGTSRIYLRVHLVTERDKLFRIKMGINAASKPDKKVMIQFNGRVLGKGKGTPSLKQGIKCIAVEREMDSEISDWPGF